jgi:hypothetical protein
MAESVTSIIAVLSESATNVTTLLPPGRWVRSWSMEVSHALMLEPAICDKMQVFDGGASGRVRQKKPLAPSFMRYCHIDVL